MQIFMQIPFIKPQNDTYTTDKWSKTMKNETKFIYFLTCHHKVTNTHS